MATTLKDHRLSFANAPDEHLDVKQFSFYASELTKKHIKADCFRMAARRSLGWNWNSSLQRLATSTVRPSATEGELGLLYLKRTEFLSGLQMLGCLLLMPTILKTDSAKNIKLVDAVLGQLGKNLVLDVLRSGSRELRNLSVDPTFVSALSLPKSLFGFGATAIQSAAAALDSSTAYRTNLKVNGMLSDKYVVDENIALEATKLLSPYALIHLEVLR